MSSQKLLKTIIKQVLLEAMIPVVKDPTTSLYYLGSQFYKPTEQGREFWRSITDYKHRNDPEHQHRYTDRHDPELDAIRKDSKNEVPENWLTFSKNSQMFHFTKTVRQAVNRRRLHGNPLPSEMIEGWYQYYYKLFFGTKPNQMPLDEEKNPHEITYKEIMEYVNSNQSSHNHRHK
jgi:hypothetical protein